jgi:hypothetical protein
MLPIVLCGFETWSVTLREEHRPRVFENRVLRKIFGPKKDEVTGKYRDYIMKFYDLYSSPNIIWARKSGRMMCSGHVARMEERRGTYRFLVGKSEGKRPFRRPRRR